MIKDKIKILVLNEPESLNGVTWWRMYRPLFELQARHSDVLQIDFSSGSIQPWDLLNYDLYFALRPQLPGHLVILREIHRYAERFKRPAKILLDFDDDNKNIPVYHLNQKDEGRNWIHTQECIKLANRLWVSTKPIANSYGHHDTEVIPNAILEEDIAPDLAPWKKSIWWGGSFRHQHDVYTWADWYARLQEKANKFYWIGWFPALPHHPTRPVIAENDVLPFDTYMSLMETERPNVIWKPLKRIPFNDAKSNIAWLQATTIGAVCVSNYAGLPGWECAIPDLEKWDEAKFYDVWTRSKIEALQNYNLVDTTEQRFLSVLNLVNS